MNKSEWRAVIFLSLMVSVGIAAVFADYWWPPAYPCRMAGGQYYLDGSCRILVEIKP